jgi:hypothetical protein
VSNKICRQAKYFCTGFDNGTPGFETAPVQIIHVSGAWNTERMSDTARLKRDSQLFCGPVLSTAFGKTKKGSQVASFT